MAAARSLVSCYNGQLVTPLFWDESTESWSPGAALLSGVDYFDDVAISGDGEHALAAGSGNGNVDPLDWNGVAWIPGAPIHVGTYPQSVDVSRDGQHALVACNVSNYVATLEWDTGTSTWTIGPTLAFPQAHDVRIAPDSEHALVVTFASNAVTPLTWSGGAWVAGSAIVTSSVGTTPYCVEFTPDGTRALVSNYTDGTLTPLSFVGGVWVAGAAIPVDADPRCIAFTSDGNEAIVGCLGGESVVTLAWDGVVWSVSASLPVIGFPAPFDCFIGADDDHAVVSASNASFVMRLERVAGVWVRGSDIPTGANPYGMALWIESETIQQGTAETRSLWRAQRTIVADEGDVLVIPQWVRRIISIPPATFALNNDVGATVTSQISGEWLRPARLTSCVIGEPGAIVLKY